MATTAGEQGTATAGGWLGDCAFLPQEVTELAPLLLTLGIGGNYPADFEALSASAGTTTVVNLGDAAFFLSTEFWGIDGNLGALFARLGNAVVGLNLGVANIGDDGSLTPAVADSSAQQVALTSLATLALARLAEPAAPAANVCELMTVDEAASILGQQPLRATDVDAGDDWGPACQYSNGAGAVELYVALDARPTAAAHFDECATGSEPVSGLGDSAYYNHFCDVNPTGRFFNVALLVRVGARLLTVAEGGGLAPDAARQAVLAVATQIVPRLGPSTQPSSTPSPSTPSPAASTPGPSTGPDLSIGFAQPCSLLSDDDVWTAVGAPITSHQELAAGPDDEQATCFYRNDDFATQPLELTLNRGEGYVAQFELWRTGGGFEPVEGIGDAAISDQYEGIADQPLVNLYFRVGGVVVTMRMGGIDRAADGTEVAPGSPDEQLFVLTELAQMVIDRLMYPPPG